MIRLPLSRGYEAIIDDADFELVGRFKWYASSNPTVIYAKRSAWIGGRETKLWLHREIMKPPAGVEIDHINHDGLDNRRYNLRFASRRENGANIYRPVGKSGFRGVWFDKRCGRFCAMASNKPSRPIYLGRFDSAEEAARAYDAHAVATWGEFATLNFPAEAS